MKVKRLAQEHNTTSPARAQIQSARSGVERTNHETTASPMRRQNKTSLASDWPKLQHLRYDLMS